MTEYRTHCFEGILCVIDGGSVLGPHQEEAQSQGVVLLDNIPDGEKAASHKLDLHGPLKARYLSKCVKKHLQRQAQP